MLTRRLYFWFSFATNFVMFRLRTLTYLFYYYLLSGRQLLWGNTARRPCCALYLGFPSILDDDLTTRDTIFMGRHSSQFPFIFSPQLLLPILHSLFVGTSSTSLTHTKNSLLSLGTLAKLEYSCQELDFHSEHVPQRTDDDRSLPETHTAYHFRRRIVCYATSIVLQLQPQRGCHF